MIRSCKSFHPYHTQDHFDAKNILSKYSRCWNTNEEHLFENTWFCQNTCQHLNALTYYMLKYTFAIKTTLLESLRDQKNPSKPRFRHNLSNGLSFSLVAQNESLRLIIIQFMFKYSVAIKTTLLESLMIQKSPGKTCYKDFVFGQSDFLRLAGSPNESI